MRGRTFIALLLVASLILPAGAALAGAQDGGDSTSSASGYTLEELQRGGKTLDNSPGSLRMSDNRMYWLIHWPASNPTADPGEDDNWKHLEPGEQVQRNAVYLRTFLFEESATRTVKIVYWQKGEQTVTRGNETVTEPVATNVTVAEHELTLTRGRPTKKIPLRQHDAPVQVTMWLEGVPEARWTFEHKSVATMQSAGISSEGDYLARASLEFLIPIAIGAFVVGFIVKRALDTAGIGPQWGYAAWLILLTLGTGAVVMFWYSSLAEIVVVAPYLLAGYVVGIIGVVLLETYTNNVSKALFIRPSLDYATAPDGEDAFDMTTAEIEEHLTVRMPDGGLAVVKKGLIPFLARAFGNAARLENAEELKMRVQLPNSKWDELYYVHPLSEEVLEYKSEGFSLNLPEPDGIGEWVNVLAVVGIIGSVGYLVAQFLSGPIAVGLVGAGVLAYVLEPVDGEARVTPAPAHMRSAHATMMALTEDTHDAETIDEARKQLQKERISTEQQVEERLEDYDETLIQEMTGTAASPTLSGNGSEATSDETALEEAETDE